MAGAPVKRFRKDLQRQVDEDGLNAQERIFCSRYQTHWDVMRALREAFGDTVRNPKKVLGKLEVKAVISREVEERTERLKLQPDWVLAELAMIIRARHRNYIREDGTEKPITEWNDEEDAAVASVEFEPIYDLDDNTGKRKLKGQRRKIRFHSKTEALSLALRNMGIDHAASAEGRDRLHEILDVFKAGPVPKTIEGQKVLESKEDKKK